MPVVRRSRVVPTALPMSRMVRCSCTEENELFPMKKKPSYLELEQRLRQQEILLQQLRQRDADLRRLAVVVRDSPDAMTVQDLEGNILEWNKGAVKMYGWPTEKAKGRNINDIVPPIKTTEFLEFIGKINTGEPVDSFETKRITADGRILDVWLTVTAILDDVGKPMAIATTERDITARKAAEKEKVDLIKQLQRALGEVKTLRGIIPICMICKRIRNDQGYWEQVEVYVHRHSEANFSHGVCPYCMKERHPRVYEKMLLLDRPKP